MSMLSLGRKVWSDSPSDNKNTLSRMRFIYEATTFSDYHAIL